MRKGLRVRCDTNRPGQFVMAQKSEEKHCFCLVLCLNEPEHPAMKGGEIN